MGVLLLVKPVILLRVEANWATDILIFHLANEEKTSKSSVTLSDLEINGSTLLQLADLLNAKIEQAQLSMNEWVREHPTNG